MTSGSGQSRDLCELGQEKTVISFHRHRKRGEGGQGGGGGRGQAPPTPII